MFTTKKHRKAIHFDIDEIKLKAAYPYHDKQHSPNDYKNTYNMIERELGKLGFRHRQYSRYISEKTLSDTEMNNVVKQLARKFYWLKGCFQKLDAENVSKNHDYVEYFNDAAENELKRRSLCESIQQKIENTKGVVQQVVVNIQKRISKGKGMSL